MIKVKEIYFEEGEDERLAYFPTLILESNEKLYPFLMPYGFMGWATKDEINKRWADFRESEKRSREFLERPWWKELLNIK